MGSTAALSEIWFLAAVSYDRFSGIHHPLDTQKRTSNKQVCCKRSTPNTNKIINKKLKKLVAMLLCFLFNFMWQRNRQPS